MLEKYFPNLYGYLVWGGGIRHIRIATTTIAVLALMGFFGYFFCIGLLTVF